MSLPLLYVPHTVSSSLLMLASHRERYDALDYSIADIEHSAGASIALSNDKSTVIMGRMRESSLSLHGIEGAFSAPGMKTVIPSCVSGKFSIRLVPNQTPDLGQSSRGQVPGSGVCKARHEE